MTALIAGEFRKLLTTRLWLWLLLGAMGITALYAGLQVGFSEDPDTMTAPLNSPEGQRTLFAVASGGADTLVAVLAAIGITGESPHKTVTAIGADPLRERSARRSRRCPISACLPRRGARNLRWLAHRLLDFRDGPRVATDRPRR